MDERQGEAVKQRGFAKGENSRIDIFRTRPRLAYLTGLLRINMSKLRPPSLRFSDTAEICLTV